MTAVKLYNTAKRAMEDFTPLDPGNVRMYVCGPTVYDRAHLGNARPVVVFDMLYRLLCHVYGADHVTYVRNFTDVDDKIIARAEETGRPIDQITTETTRWFLDDMAALGALEPTHMPRATDHIGGMVAMIEGLLASGNAYAAEGHVLFDVRSYADYGKLSGRSVDDMIAGARVEVAPYKRDPMDFVLWKPSSDDQPGWDSPWGRGRPGWHIECSAMADAILGDTFDIHGGGNDLMFPHHENEIAQSRCAHPDAAFARVWMHNEMLQIDGKKMSKSLGNFFTVRDLLERYRAEAGFENFGPAIRLRFLLTQYRGLIDFTDASLDEAATKLGHWWASLNDHLGDAGGQGTVPDRVIAALSDDLNTPAAISEIDAMVSDLRKPVRKNRAGDDAYAKSRLAADIAASLGLLGLSLDDMAEFHHANRSKRRRDALDTDVGALIDRLIKERSDARANRDFARADQIRDAFTSAGVEVQDKPGGPSEWSLKDGFDLAKLEALK